MNKICLFLALSLYTAYNKGMSYFTAWHTPHQQQGCLLRESFIYSLEEEDCHPMITFLQRDPSLSSITFTRKSNKKKITPLQIALARKNYEMAQILINYGASVNAVNNENQTLLHIFIQAPITPHKEMLKENKTYQDLPPDDRMERDKLLILAFLLRNKANALITDKTGQTPLHKAAFKGYYLIAQQLIQACKQENITSYVNMKDTKGNTPLHLIFIEKSHPTNKEDRSIAFTRLLLTDLLLKKGADPTIKNKKGWAVKDYQEFQLLQENKLI